jgi:protein-tyrosine phosphatase
LSALFELPRLLVVCAFNICGSPATAALLVKYSGLSDHGLVMSTAGTEPGANEFGGSAACIEMVSELSQRFPEIVDYRGLSTHISSQLTSADIEQADLILVMERQQRSQVVRLLPSAQRKTFLLTQAARLSAWILNQEHPERGRAATIVDALDDARGLAPYLEDVDVDDPHRTGGPAHSAMIRNVESASHSIAALLRELYS